MTPTTACRALQLLAVAALACTASAAASATIKLNSPGMTFAIIGGERVAQLHTRCQSKCPSLLHFTTLISLILLMPQTGGASVAM